MLFRPGEIARAFVEPLRPKNLRRIRRMWAMEEARWEQEHVEDVYRNAGSGRNSTISFADDSRPTKSDDPTPPAQMFSTPSFGGRSRFSRYSIQDGGNRTSEYPAELHEDSSDDHNQEVPRGAGAAPFYA